MVNKKKSKAAHPKARSASPLEADRDANRTSRATQLETKSADQGLADRIANTNRMAGRRKARPPHQVETARIANKKRRAIQRNARSQEQVEADRATDRKRTAVQRAARLDHQVEADRAANTATKATRRAARSDHQVEADRAANTATKVTQRESRLDHQVEADRAANTATKATQRAARLDHEAEAHRATHQTRSAVQREARSADQVEANRDTDKKRKAGQRGARPANQVEADRAAHTATTATQRAARSRQQDTTRGTRVNQEMTAEDLLKETADMTKANIYFRDFQYDPTKALMLYYANSGYLRFDQYKEYGSVFQGKAVEQSNVATEVGHEELSADELAHIVQQFQQRHSPLHSRLMSCGGCGIRLYERPSGPEIKFCQVDLQSTIVAHLQYTDADMMLLESARRKCARVDLVVDEINNRRTVDPWQLKSVYKSRASGTLYHLHPELVAVDADGAETTHLCPSCLKVLRKGRVPSNSIAAGVDFGVRSRLGLEELNMHEEVILSRCRLFQATIKLSTVKGNRVACHAIVFADDSPEVASAALSSDAMFDGERLKHTLKLYLVDEKKNFDRLYKKLYGTVSIFARPWVIHQWLVVLIAVHPHYSFFVAPNYPALKRTIDDTNKYILDNCVCVSDETVLDHDRRAGSDVAAQMGGGMDSPVASTGDAADEQTEGIQYRFVTTAPSVANIPEATQIQMQLRALHTLVGTEEEDDDSEMSAEHDELREQLELLASTNDNTGVAAPTGAFAPARSRTGEEDDDELKEQLELLASANDNAGLALAPTPATAPTDVFTATRSNTPLTDFSVDDFVISCSFPTVFMFGRAYHRSTGTLSFDQKNHVLKQYTAIPAKNRRLLFYLFDTIKRYKSICGVNAYVKRDRRSVEALGALIGDAAERSTIKRAAENPDDKESKAVLHKYLKHLRFAGKDIAYGPMEMAKLKSYVLESCNRYGPCSSFLTLSFSEPNNTRGLRATFSTVDNSKFPATFHDGCEFGSNPRRVHGKDTCSFLSCLVRQYIGSQQGPNGGTPGRYGKE